MYLEAEAALGPGQQAVYFPDRDALMEALEDKARNLIPEGWAVLVKASHGMEFDRVRDFLCGGPG